MNKKYLRRLLVGFLLATVFPPTRSSRGELRELDFCRAAAIRRIRRIA